MKTTPNYVAISYGSIFVALVSIFVSKLTSHEVIGFISLCFFVTLAVISCIMYAKQKNNIYYEKGGDLENWYPERLNQLGTDWCKEFIEEIAKILSSANFSFLSPSANEGTYEKAMFLHISKQVNVQFYLSDLALLPNHEDNIEGISSFTYFPQVDAKEIFNILPISKIDVIFDMKGALWHGSLKHKRELIQIYNKHLSNNGFLILDNVYVNPVKCILVQILYYIFRILHFKSKLIRLELSSMQVLQYCFLRRYLFQYFEPDKNISHVAQHKKLKFLILRKKVLYS